MKIDDYSSDYFNYKPTLVLQLHQIFYMYYNVLLKPANPNINIIACVMCILESASAPSGSGAL